MKKAVLVPSVVVLFAVAIGLGGLLIGLRVARLKQPVVTQLNRSPATNAVAAESVTDDAEHGTVLFTLIFGFIDGEKIAALRFPDGRIVRLDPDCVRFGDGPKAYRLPTF